jgi:hypothetical protein
MLLKPSEGAVLLYEQECVACNNCNVHVMADLAATYGRPAGVLCVCVSTEKTCDELMTTNTTASARAEQ